MSDQIPSMHPLYKSADLVGFVDKNGDLKDKRNYVYINDANFNDGLKRSLASFEKRFFDSNFAVTKVTIIKNEVGIISD